MPSSPGPLLSAIRKLERAEEHISDVKREVESFQDACPYTTFLDYDTQPGRTLVKLRFLNHPRRIVVCAADAIQNLRSALDHLAWQVYLRHRPRSGKPLTPRKVAFTISDTRDEHFRPERQGLIRNIGGDMWAAFVNKQKPYAGGNQALYALNFANNLDKHRDILEVGTFPVGISVASALGSSVSFDGFRRWPIEDEITIASYDGHVEVNGDVESAFAIVLGEIEGFTNEPVAKTLDKFADEVRAVLERARTLFFP